MSNVVNFNQEIENRYQYVWLCNCGCSSFIIYEKGDIECAACGLMQTDWPHYATTRNWIRKVEEDE